MFLSSAGAARIGEQIPLDGALRRQPSSAGALTAPRQRHPARAGRGRPPRPLAMFPGPGETRRRRGCCQGPRPPKVNPGGAGGGAGRGQELPWECGALGAGGARRSRAGAWGERIRDARAEFARAVSDSEGKHLGRRSFSRGSGGDLPLFPCVACPRNPGWRPAPVRS